MEKIKSIAWIIGSVVFVYLILLGTWGFMTTIVTDTAAEMSRRPGIENYVKPVEAVQAMPWVLFFVPAVGGAVATVIVLKRN